MAIIKQGILGGFKKKIGSVVGSSWKGIATMRSLPLSIANPKTAAQVENRNRFKSCAQFASLILAPIIKPLMDRFAGQMSGYNYFTKLNKGVFANPENVAWDDLIIAKGKLLPPSMNDMTVTGSSIAMEFNVPESDRYGLPTDKIFVLIVASKDNSVVFAGDTGATRQSRKATVQAQGEMPTTGSYEIYMVFLRADGSEVSNTGFDQLGV